MSTLKPAAENSLCQLSSLSKSSDVSVLLSCFSRRFFPQDVFQICRFMIFVSTVKTIALSKLSYQRRCRLDLYDQNPKISLLLSGLDLRQIKFLTERFILQAIHSDKIEKPPNKVQKSTTTRTEIQGGLTQQVVYYFTKFQLADTQFPSAVTLEMKSK